MDDCSWITVGTRTAENRGQKVGHLTKMHNFRLLLFLNITLTYKKLSLF